MSKKAVSILLKYGISVVLCAVVTGIYIFYKDLSSLSQKDALMAWCDGFFLPGILLIFAGLMVFVSNNGVFNGIGYVLHVVVHALIPGGRYNMEKYGDYIAQKREKQLKGYGFLFIVGAVFVGIALVFFVLYSQY